MKRKRTFAELLTKTIATSGMTRTEVAAKSGLQPAAISHFCTGRRAPSLKNLIALADTLGVTIDSLVGRAPPLKVDRMVLVRLADMHEESSGIIRAMIQREP